MKLESCSFAVSRVGRIVSPISSDSVDPLAGADIIQGTCYGMFKHSLTLDPGSSRSYLNAIKTAIGNPHEPMHVRFRIANRSTQSQRFGMELLLARAINLVCFNRLSPEHGDPVPSPFTYD